ncbi:unnamed protein product [Schistosoma curassoni]|uniref:Uncharacterized protein n=1 Tax=Schistosoma curassoni TaxID=6186 RepID=A0A183JYF4_9TREM|nr:unnamed protein product [Schistosoma curassoni]
MNIVPITITSTPTTTTPTATSTITTTSPTHQSILPGLIDWKLLCMLLLLLFQFVAMCSHFPTEHLQ